jgi:hypothetical protein
LTILNLSGTSKTEAIAVIDISTEVSAVLARKPTHFAKVTNYVTQVLAWFSFRAEGARLRGKCIDPLIELVTG